ncbi:Gfo/Idh/MocA family oxidoreductase [Candidatus Micrarchaeota archaeon]|nr:Gfo/Idh/MocA family oxidoreductase [Candidatus Micrarchaeota archaeon]
MNVLVVGAGAMGRHHIRNYVAMHDVAFVHVVEPNAESKKQLTEMNLDGKVRVHDSLQEALKEKPQAASIVVPTPFHAQVAGILLEKGIACLVEKPLAASIPEGVALKALAEKHEAVLCVGHIERFNPGVQTLKKHLHQIGDIVYASAHRFGVPSPRKLGHAFFDQGVHDMDVLCYLTGKKPETVFGVHQAVLDSYDVASAILEFPGFYAAVETNRVTPIKTRQLIVTGTKGSAHLDYITQELTVTLQGDQKPEYKTFDEILWRAGRGTEMRPYFTKKEPLRAELEHFLEAAKGNEKPLCTAQDGLNAIAIAQACVDSATTGKKVPVPKTP